MAGSDGGGAALFPFSAAGGGVRPTLLGAAIGLLVALLLVGWFTRGRMWLRARRGAPVG